MTCSRVYPYRYLVVGSILHLTMCSIFRVYLEINVVLHSRETGLSMLGGSDNSSIGRLNFGQNTFWDAGRQRSRLCQDRARIELRHATSQVDDRDTTLAVSLESAYTQPRWVGWAVALVLRSEIA